MEKVVKTGLKFDLHMCKRYIIDESGIILKPDNQSCNYSNIAVSETDWVVQGKVIYW